MPPKVHNLVYLLNKMNIKPPEEPGKFIIKLNEANIASRYPEDLSIIQQIYTRPIVEEILSQGKEVVIWIRTQL